MPTQTKAMVLSSNNSNTLLTLRLDRLLEDHLTAYKVPLEVGIGHRSPSLFLWKLRVIEIK